VDVAVVGSGFGGSLTAILLERIGRSVCLIDRGAHPRFAIGESSTPNADLMLLQIAERYELPWLAPLAKYGTWQQTYPHIGCGLKRGFSYFHHRAGQPFQADPLHTTELLVAASPDDARSDTHWMRADVDALFAAQAVAAGIPLIDNTSVELEQAAGGWRLVGQRRDEPVRIDARFVIDGTGEFGLVPRALGFRSATERLATNSRTIFAHFRGMERWQDVLTRQGGDTADHPFRCDDAAVHQVLDDGWMYQLPFNQGVTSAGFVLDAVEHPLRVDVPMATEWESLLKRYPSLAEQFAGAEIVAPPEGLRRTGRLQRLMDKSAGESWALLPHTAGFIDPLHSTGIAQTLCGIQRLIMILEEHWDRPPLPAALKRYERSLRQEILLIDKLVSGCYLTRRDFRLFTAFAMLYFAAATTSEQRRLAGELAPGEGFLCADDPAFCGIVERAWHAVRDLASQPGATTYDAVSRLVLNLATETVPYNRVGLFDSGARNMYRYTAIAKPG
jgi:FADH2 O2-dependent halogenase